MLYPRPASTPFADVCWSCRIRIAGQQRGLSEIVTARHLSPFIPGSRPKFRLNALGLQALTRQSFHASQFRPRASVVAATTDPSSLSTPDSLPLHARTSPTRKALQRWQDEYGGPNEDDLRAFPNHPASGETSNNLARMNFPGKSDDDFNEPFDNDEDEMITIGLFLKPGDVVELRMQSREPVLAAFVQDLQSVSQFYTATGKWCHTNLQNIRFAIPGCIDPALVKPIIPYLPTKLDTLDIKRAMHVPLALGAPVLSILERLTNQSEDIYRGNAHVLDSAYSTLADQTRTRMMTLTQIAKTLLGRNDPAWKPSPPALLAVRKALMHNEFRFRSDYRSQRLTNVFAIRPKGEVEVIEAVRDWVRQYLEHEAQRTTQTIPNSSFKAQNPPEAVTYIAQFIEKARRLIARSRELRDPLEGFVGPCKARLAHKEKSPAMHITWGEEFSTTDKQIITFLQAWVLMMQFHNIPSLQSAGVALLQATGCYEKYNKFRDRLDKMNMSTGHLFLQEIGVITPYENRILHDESLMLPTVRLSRNLELLTTKAELTRRQPDFRDSMAELRRDWGAMNVYCIDNPGSKEIDDGLSIEKVQGKKSDYWIHVHIANPTAFFDKTHVLSGLAAHMTESVYVPERSFPMLPTWVTQNYFSLDRNRPVLTFSTRVDLAGNILETKIQPGIIRQVIHVSPVEVAEILGEQPLASVRTFVVGGEIPDSYKTQPRKQLPPSQVQELRDFYTVARSLWERRKAAGGIRGATMLAEPHVFAKPGRKGLDWAPPSTDRARYIHGDPIIELRSQLGRRTLNQDLDATNITEEMMILAGHAAASWCAVRGIPVMFRGTIEMPRRPGVLSLDEFKEKILQPYLDRDAEISPLLLLQYLQAVGRAITHTSPIVHKMIGVESYLKITSPLRRFSDMISHWQIEAALRHEARTGKKFSADEVQNAARPILPFSHRQVQESIITLSPRENLITKTKKISNLFWATQAFMRAFYFKEAELPKTFKVWVKKTKENFLMVETIIIELGVTVHLERLNEDMRVGDEWEVEIYFVSAFLKEIFARPIRLVERPTWTLS
ncbi:RNB-domain-containing protein [Lindgomyces ingoldianus]|uniref:RNB-domain-containing protein n=1 Tax=Lindgomyces ingoldianus TaxID=673940 RepID=A0ACB6QRG1_9PLEO|nr:RNB-domain-containing protein [Lindgomyces ingoldianus]KAF2469105.1 RNB-domain-containing protein [Lindgomyces ingoldianus]